MSVVPLARREIGREPGRRLGKIVLDAGSDLGGMTRRGGKHQHGTGEECQRQSSRHHDPSPLSTMRTVALTGAHNRN
jgi:hypothetical protein